MPKLESINKRSNNSRNSKYYEAIPMENWPIEIEGSRELQCVGRMEIVRPKPVGFLCGSIPVPTDNSFHAFNSALVPSRQTVSAPRYRMLPTETDLNRPPVVSNFPEKVLPMGAVQSKTTGDIKWEGGAIESKLNKKCEALAVSGLVEYGDEIDIIAAADILKQIFKIPYSKARLSIAVRRVGQTLVLNTGPDIEEGEKFIRRHSSQAKCADQSLFLNFAMHSVRMEACDCPPTHYPPTGGNPSSSVLPGAEASHFVEPNEDIPQEEGVDHSSEYSELQHDGFLWESKKNKRNKGRNSIKKATHVSEKPRGSVQESEKCRRIGNNGFLRVLFWQFHNFRMLLGSDLLLFSNEKYAAVSLHLWDVTRQVTPLNWLEAWLDNVMASVPELAICYHQNGVVQGYELLKTHEIFLLKGISEDGTPAFHPHFVQQNGLTVLRFLQDNCKQDPGAYWLYKSAGEDVIQLFDLAVIPKNHSSGDGHGGSSALPSIVHRGRSDSLFSLGTLLYRIAHRLSLSMAAKNRAKCARFFKKCLDLLDEPDHLVVRAFAHEQFARLILNNDEELDMAMESFPIEYDATVTGAEEESVDAFRSLSEPAAHEDSILVWEVEQSVDGISCLDLSSQGSAEMSLRANLSAPKKLIASPELDLEDEKRIPPSHGGDENLSMCKISETHSQVVQTVSSPVSSKLAAVHHVSQAIKSLRWMRQLESSEPVIVDGGNDVDDDQLPSPVKFSVCTCGDADCIEVCDIREWLPTSKLDHKLWKLILLLGESYLALGQAYKENGQLHQALEIVELASSVYGSMPKQLEDTKFISSIVKCPSSKKLLSRNWKTSSLMADATEVGSSSDGNSLTLEHFSSTYLFWAKAWMLVGDVYVEFHLIKDKDVLRQADQKLPSTELQMSSEVVKEVQRLKKKLGQYNQNCSSCSLVNCSCQSDRVSSGNSASSSSGDTHTVPYNRKHTRRSYAKSVSNSPVGDHQENVVEKEESRSQLGCGQFKNVGDGTILGTLSKTGSSSLAVNGLREVEGSSGMQNEEFVEVPLIENKGTPQVKNGGIFKYLRGPMGGDTDYNLSVALSCYEEARKALVGFPSGSAELLSVMKKKGWVWNEMGRNRLERKELDEAELAFAEAINAFREVSDYTNIVLINCNLGHGRRALAEENVTRIEGLKRHAIFQNAYKQALEAAKFEYGKSLRYYGAAIAELDSVIRGWSSVPSGLKNEVYTQFAHTYLRLGMFLARENTIAEVLENRAVENCNLTGRRARKEFRKHEISANEALRKALAVYESLGELRKQEAAYAYFQLASYQRDCCLKLLETDDKKSSMTKGDQRVKQYASLADRNWQKAIDFYRPQTHPTMYLTILLERSALLLSHSSPLHSNTMLESALSHLFGGRDLPESFSDSFRRNYPELHGKFWSQLQMILKKMLAVALGANSNKSSPAAQSGVPQSRFADAGKLREIYKMSLKSNDLSQLHAIYSLWTS